MKSRSRLCAALLLVSPSLLAQGEPVKTYEDRAAQLSLDFAGLPELRKVTLAIDSKTTPAFGHQRTWAGKIGESRLELSFWFHDKKLYSTHEPADMVDVLDYNHSFVKRDGDRNYRPLVKNCLVGNYGYAQIICYSWGQKHAENKSKAKTVIQACGLLEDKCYSIEITCKPPVKKAAVQTFLEFFAKGIRYTGKKRVYRWSKDEAAKRWNSATPKKLHEKLEIVRTKHFIILTNAAGSSIFAMKMESCYKTIKKAFPFQEVEGLRLLPVFVFQRRSEYLDFCSKVLGKTSFDADRTMGIAWKDFYVTTYESPNDPVHLHEVTHQLFATRLGLDGAGSWFQEGVAEYLAESRRKILNFAKPAAMKRTFERFKQFFLIEDLLSEEGSNAHNLYLQAASIIHFLANSRFGKHRFQDFIHAMGRVPGNDVDAIRSCLRHIYDCNIEVLEDEWVAYWKKQQ